jgi:hypothetical protein
MQVAGAEIARRSQGCATFQHLDDLRSQPQQMSSRERAELTVRLELLGIEELIRRRMAGEKMSCFSP